MINIYIRNREESLEQLSQMLKQEQMKKLITQGYSDKALSVVELVKKSYAENINAPVAYKPTAQTEPPKAAVQPKPVEVTKAIDKAVLDSNYELYRYDLKKAVATVIAECGAERVSNVLADYIHRHYYDGRISHQNKEWAKDFEKSDNRYGLVFDTHPAVLDGFISEARVQIKELEKVQEPKLSSIYDDRFLLSTERVELKDDYRGIPETKYFNSSVNEYFVDKIGWLDNAAYNHEQKSSNLSAKDFYANVEKINANYIDVTGKTGQIDMTKQEYDLSEYSRIRFSVA